MLKAIPCDFQKQKQKTTFAHHDLCSVLLFVLAYSYQYQKQKKTCYLMCTFTKDKACFIIGIQIEVSCGAVLTSLLLHVGTNISPSWKKCSPPKKNSSWVPKAQAKVKNCNSKKKASPAKKPGAKPAAKKTAKKTAEKPVAKASSVINSALSSGNVNKNPLPDQKLLAKSCYQKEFQVLVAVSAWMWVNGLGWMREKDIEHKIFYACHGGSTGGFILMFDLALHGEGQFERLWSGISDIGSDAGVDGDKVLVLNNDFTKDGSLVLLSMKAFTQQLVHATKQMENSVVIKGRTLLNTAKDAMKNCKKSLSFADNFLLAG